MYTKERSQKVWKKERRRMRGRAQHRGRREKGRGEHKGGNGQSRNRKLGVEGVCVCVCTSENQLLLSMTAL